MKSAALILERFDASLAAVGSSPLEQARADSFAEGYAAGQRAALSESDDKQTLFLSAAEAVRAELADAQEKMLGDAADGLAAILEKLLPALSREGFAHEAAEALKQLVQERDDASFEIAAAPDYAGVLEKRLAAGAPRSGITVMADSSLNGSVAHARWNGGGLILDMDRAASECLDAFRRFLSNHENEVENDG